jgi:uncharacterized membrane protein YgcG
MIKKICCVIGLLLIAVYGHTQCDALPRPKVSVTKKADGGTHTHQHRIHDFSNIIDDTREQALEKLVYKFEDSTSFQLALVTVDDLGGNTGIDYGTTLGNCWGVGQKGRENGILVLVSYGARDWAIVTGRGSEIYLRDGETRLIAENHLIPALRSNDATTGLEETVDAIINHLGWLSWEVRESNRLEEERQAELIAQQRRQEFADGAKSFFFYLFQIVLLGLASFFGYKGFRLLAKKREIKKKMHEWEQKFISIENSLAFDDSVWPSWAKDALANSKSKIKEAIDRYYDLKNAFWETKFEEALKKLPTLEAHVENIVELMYQGREIPEKIEFYKGQAGIAVTSAEQSQKQLQSEIEQMQANGFDLKRFTSAMQAITLSATTLGHLKMNLANPQREIYKAVYEEATNTTNVLKKQRAFFTEIVANHTRIVQEAPKIQGKIKTLKQNYERSNTLSLLQQICPESVWGGLTKDWNAVPEYLDTADKELVIAQTENDLKVQHFDEANRSFATALSYVQKIEQTFASLQSTYSSQSTAKEQYAQKLAKAKNAVSSAEGECSDSDVEYTTKSSLSNVKKDLKTATVSTSLADWVLMNQLLGKVLSNAQAVESRAKNDISDAESSRRRARESSYTSSSSSSSYTSSGSSFGGGSFGGGGSGGKF